LERKKVEEVKGGNAVGMVEELSRDFFSPLNSLNFPVPWLFTHCHDQPRNTRKHREERMGMILLFNFQYLITSSRGEKETMARRLTYTVSRLVCTPVARLSMM